MQLTHVEVSVPLGTLTPAFVDELDRLLVDVFGWEASSPGTERRYAMGGVNLVLREGEAGLVGGTDDHLGFVVGDDELDGLLQRCLAVEGVEFQHVVDGRPASVDLGNGSAFRTFFVRYRLPVWFQFESRR